MKTIGKIIQFILLITLLVALSALFYKTEILNYITTEESLRDYFGNGKLAGAFDWEKALAQTVVGLEIATLFSVGFKGVVNTTSAFMEKSIAERVEDWLLFMYTITTVFDFFLTWYFCSVEQQLTQISYTGSFADLMRKFAPLVVALLITGTQIVLVVVFGYFINAFFKIVGEREKQQAKSENKNKQQQGQNQQVQQDILSTAQRISQENYNKNNHNRQPSYTSRNPDFRR